MPFAFWTRKNQKSILYHFRLRFLSFVTIVLYYIIIIIIIIIIILLLYCTIWIPIWIPVGSYLILNFPVGFLWDNPAGSHQLSGIPRACLAGILREFRGNSGTIPPIHVGSHVILHFPAGFLWDKPAGSHQLSGIPRACLAGILREFRGNSD